MARIVSKLNLNKTPGLVDNNSMVFARNIRFLEDGSIGRDYGISGLGLPKTSIELGDLVSSQLEEIDPQGTEHSDDPRTQELINDYIAMTDYLYGLSTSITFDIVGVIPYNDKFFIFLDYYDDGVHNSFIMLYNEESQTYFICDANWTYSGGIITGDAIINLKGETILNIAEYKDDDTQIPFKTINLNISSYLKSESVYTQLPVLAITNLSVAKYYTKQIPNGTYQFFVRYKIADDLYTDWTPATNILYSCNKYRKTTVAGTIYYADMSSDSNTSFVFDVSHLNPDALDNYKSFQVGFILNSGDKVVARSWKHFTNDTTRIYFDYDRNFIEEIDIADLIGFKYGIFNVRNVTSFKNKLYISNYKETDFNPNFSSYANTVNVSIDTSGTIVPLGNITYSFIDNGRQYVRDLEIIDNTELGLRFIDGILEYPTEEDTVWIQSDIANELFQKILDGDPDSSNPNYDPTAEPLYNIVTAMSEPSIEDSASYTIMGFTLTAYVQNKENYSGGSSHYYTKFGNNDGTGHTVQYTSDLVNRYLKNKLWYGCINTGECVPTIDDTTNIYNTVTTYWGGHMYTIRLTITFNPNNVHVPEVENVNCSSLVPGQSYKFFIHYVKANGEITNGYPIHNGEEYTVDIETYAEAITNHNVIYPSFSNITFPNGYDYCFISIAKTKGFTAELFNIKKKTYNSDVNTAQCMELDTRLLYILDNIPCTFIQDNSGTISVITNEGNKYYASYDQDNTMFLGGGGDLLLSDVSITNVVSGFITLQESKNEDKLSLVRCTPFIGKNEESPSAPVSYNNYNEMNLLGFICSVNKALGEDSTTVKDFFDRYYIAGSEVYFKIYHTYISAGVETVSLSETVTGSGNYPMPLNIPNVSDFTVYSNYNLACLSLRADIRSVVKQYKSDSTNKVAVNLINSLEASDLFELQPMFKDITQKTYIPYSDSTIVKFDNTIRSSNVIGDEKYGNIYKFGSTDYYNVPTTKGIIVNLCALGNYIIVHTEDSMFKFVGNNTISASGGEDIALKESDVFDTGISEVFGSEYGFGGLKEKAHALALPESYIYYDKDSNEMYIYSGQGQIAKISDPIEKLLNSESVADVIFAGDYYNNRVFVKIVFIMNTVEYPIILSYNFKHKCFASTHNFTYTKSFNTKTNCYFYDNIGIRYVNKYATTYMDSVRYDDHIYPSYKFIPNPLTPGTYRYGAIVDIIFNENIESIKTLNALSWIASKINSFRYVGNEGYYPIFMAEENLDRKYAGNKIRIYTDTCSTNLLDITQRSNDSSIDTLNSYMYPRYNQGVWTFNYFRDIVNIEDIFNYIKNSTDQTAVEARGNTGETYPQNLNPQEIDLKYTDNHSLIEGKYFIVRFVFDPANNFKLENVSLNTSNKLNYE